MPHAHTSMLECTHVHACMYTLTYLRVHMSLPACTNVIACCILTCPCLQVAMSMPVCIYVRPYLNAHMCKLACTSMPVSSHVHACMHTRLCLLHAHTSKLAYTHIHFCMHTRPCLLHAYMLSPSAAARLRSYRKDQKVVHAVTIGCARISP